MIIYIVFLDGNKYHCIIGTFDVQNMLHTACIFFPKIQFLNMLAKLWKAT
jgi:hypothetical protein